MKINVSVMNEDGTTAEYIEDQGDKKSFTTALDGLVDNFTSILQYTVDKIKDDVSLCLKANRLVLSNLDGMDSVFKDDNPFHNLNTKSLQEKFYKEHFNLLVSITSLLLTYSNLIL